VSAAILGFAGIVAAALFALAGVRRTGRPPAHLADVEGLKTLADELRVDRDDLRAQVAARDQRITELTGKLAAKAAEVASVSAQLAAVAAELAQERAAQQAARLQQRDIDRDDGNA
jgi:peptidoglycan hydrolase CwlO-like protein